MKDGMGHSPSRSASSGSGSSTDDELGSILTELDVVISKMFGDNAANSTDLAAAVQEAFDGFDTDNIGFLNRCCPPAHESHLKCIAKGARNPILLECRLRRIGCRQSTTGCILCD
jgi:hypothetical protein